TMSDNEELFAACLPRSSQPCDILSFEEISCELNTVRVGTDVNQLINSTNEEAHNNATDGSVSESSLASTTFKSTSSESADFEKSSNRARSPSDRSSRHSAPACESHSKLTRHSSSTVDGCTDLLPSEADTDSEDWANCPGEIENDEVDNSKFTAEIETENSSKGAVVEDSSNPNAAVIFNRTQESNTEQSNVSETDADALTESSETKCFDDTVDEGEHNVTEMEALHQPVDTREELQHVAEWDTVDNTVQSAKEELQVTEPVETDTAPTLGEELQQVEESVDTVEDTAQAAGEELQQETLDSVDEVVVNENEITEEPHINKGSDEDSEIDESRELMQELDAGLISIGTEVDGESPGPAIVANGFGFSGQIEEIEKSKSQTEDTDDKELQLLENFFSCAPRATALQSHSAEQQIETGKEDRDDHIAEDSKCSKDNNVATNEDGAVESQQGDPSPTDESVEMAVGYQANSQVDQTEADSSPTRRRRRVIQRHRSGRAESGGPDSRDRQLREARQAYERSAAELRQSWQGYVARLRELRREDVDNAAAGESVRRHRRGFSEVEEHWLAPGESEAAAEVRAWLLDKKRVERQKRQQDGEQRRREQRERLNAKTALDERQRAAQKAYQSWLRRKQRQAASVAASAASLAEASDSAESEPHSQLFDLLSARCETPNQTAKRHQPVHNSVFPRPMSSIAATRRRGAASSREPPRIVIAGRQLVPPKSQQRSRGSAGMDEAVPAQPAATLLTAQFRQ
ncbi:hypothetical protein BOX15_Mlig002566g3, partial [Macrostomum lignano]